jgi:hypothetical protein
MKITQVCKTSGLTCENFGYAGKIKKLPDVLKYAPQHLISDGDKIRLVYYKPSYDDRYIEISREEINTIRDWNSNIHRVLVFVFNYRVNRYTVFTMDEINRKMFTCKKETINNFLFDNTGFTWYNITDKLELGLYGR